MRALPLIALTLALAACGKQSRSTTTVTTNSETGVTTTTTNADSSGIPTAVSLGLQPGKWETKISVTQMEINGITRSAPPGGESVLTCLTPEMAAKGPGEMLKKTGVDCTATNQSFADGKIAVQMTCKMPMGTMTSTTTGTYSPTAMSSDAEATVTGRMTMKEQIHTEAHRVGDCG